MELAVDVCFLEHIVTALGQNTSLKSNCVSIPNDGLFLLAVLTALMRTGMFELYIRVLQLLDVIIRFDNKGEKVLLGKWYITHSNTTAKFLSPAKISSLCAYEVPFRYVGDTSFLFDLCTLSELVIKDTNLSRNNIKCITEGFLVHCKSTDSKSGARSLVNVEGGTEQSNKTCTLEHIELTNCDIGHLEAQHLAQALCVNISVKTLTIL